MATNQVIHGSNRVVENPNRYKLNAVSGQANTYDLEKVPGTITDNGTPYSKQVLDKIDNVLSYLTPSVEKTLIEPLPVWIEQSTSIDIISEQKTFYGTWTETIQYYNAHFSEFSVSLRAPSSTYPVYFYAIVKYNDGTTEETNRVSHNSTSFSTKTCRIVNSANKGIIEIEYNSYCANTSSLSYFKTLKFTKEKVISGYIDNYQNQFTLDNNSNTFINNERVLVETPSLLDMTNVTSNTLNGIDIKTIFQPSSKYELIYNESANKFELGKLSENILFEILLTEAVNVIDLTGISDKLENGKLYTLIVLGGQTSDTTFLFGDKACGYLDTWQSTSTIRANITYFTPFDYENIKYITALYVNNTSFSIQKNSTLTGNEYIKAQSTYTFNAGTRIIIKEVA